MESEYRRTASVTSLLNGLGWPTLQSRRSLHRLTLFYKAVNSQIAISLHDLLPQARCSRGNTGLSKVFTPVGSACDVYKFSFIPRTIVEWNKLLSDEIRNSTSTEAFSKAASAAVLQFY